MTNKQEHLINHAQLALDTIDDLIINGSDSINDIEFSINDVDEDNKSINLYINFSEDDTSKDDTVQLFSGEVIDYHSDNFRQQIKRSRNYNDKIMSSNDNE
ncbi:hypothetical protein AABD41_01805 [Staphylococcus pseudoxylosus]|uniref:hypothetical protein n=1 Tax=Staphylococcus pseudoxylosus TaxID=2282419 RepID=UPI00398AFB86